MTSHRDVGSKLFVFKTKKDKKLSVSTIVLTVGSDTLKPIHSRISTLSRQRLCHRFTFLWCVPSLDQDKIYCKIVEAHYILVDQLKMLLLRIHQFGLARN